MSPRVAHDGDIGVVDTRKGTRGVDSSSMIHILIDFNGKVDSAVFGIEQDLSRHFHSFWVLRLNVILRQGVLGVELSEVVAADSIGVEIGTEYANHIGVNTLVLSVEGALNDHITCEAHACILVNDLEVFDNSHLQLRIIIICGEGVADDVDVPGHVLHSNQVVQDTSLDAHAVHRIPRKPDLLVHLFKSYF